MGTEYANGGLVKAEGQLPADVPTAGDYFGWCTGCLYDLHKYESMNSDEKA